MNTILIGYDLNRPGQNYSALFDALKSLSNANRWWHNLDSTWIIVTEKSAEEVRDHLASVTVDGKKVLDGSDELLAVDVTGRARAWRGFPESGSKWLKETFV